MASQQKRTIAEVVARLQKMDQAAEVEYVVCKTDGEILDISVTGQTTKPMIKMLKMFGGANG